MVYQIKRAFETRLRLQPLPLLHIHVHVWLVPMIRGPHLMRVREQEKEIQGGMVGKEERSAAEARCWRSQTSDPRRPALKALPNLSLNVSDTLRATRAK